MAIIKQKISGLDLIPIISAGELFPSRFLDLSIGEVVEIRQSPRTREGIMIRKVPLLTAGEAA